MFSAGGCWTVGSLFVTFFGQIIAPSFGSVELANVPEFVKSAVEMGRPLHDDTKICYFVSLN